MVPSAVADTLASLDDPTAWIIKRGVPLFRSHVRRGAKGEVAYEVTEDDLPEIAANCAALERIGHLGRIIDGHINTDPKAPESSQPQLLGVQRNFRMGTLLDGTTPAVVYDEYLKPDALPIAKQRLYRSAEYRPNSKRISGVAMLTRDPALDLGTVLYDGDEPVYHYSLGSTVEYSMPDPVAAPAAPAKPAAPTAPAGPPQWTPEEQAMFEKCAAYFRSKNYMAPMGPTNAATPAPVVPNQQKPPMPNASDEQVQQYQAENETLKQRIGQLEADGKKSRAEKLLGSLAKYQFDPADELATLTALPEEAWPKHAERIRKYHHARPGQSEPIEVYAGHVEGGTVTNDPARPAADHDQIMTYMRDHPGMQYQDAAREVRAKK